MTYHEACAALGVDGKFPQNVLVVPVKKKGVWIPKPPDVPPTAKWQDEANRFVNQSHEWLFHADNHRLLDRIEKGRCLSPMSIRHHKLGYLASDIYYDREQWGLHEAFNDQGRPKKLFIPAGLVIPTYSDGQIVRIKIRRRYPGDFGRYYAIEGSQKNSSFQIGLKPNLIGIVVESELDTILFSQELGGSAGVVALGSASNRPNADLTSILRQCPQLLISLDTDEAGGKAMWQWWMKNFANAARAIIPSRFGKDPTEAMLNGLDLRDWFLAAGGTINKSTGDSPVIYEHKPDESELIRLCTDCAHYEKGGHCIRWSGTMREPQKVSNVQASSCQYWIDLRSKVDPL